MRIFAGTTNRIILISPTFAACYWFLPALLVRIKWESGVNPELSRSCEKLH